MTSLDLRSLDVGARVQHTLRVADRAEKSTADGDPFVILTLGNASGEIQTAPIWANLLAQGWAEGAERGAVVQAIGQIDRYEAKGAVKRQLKLTAPVRVLPRGELDLADFLPHIAEDPQRLWEQLDKLRRDIASARLKRVLALFYDDEPFRLRFERTPASINGHHCKVGGLLLHVWEVAYMARHMAKAMRASEDRRDRRRAAARHRQDRGVRRRVGGIRAHAGRESHRARRARIDDARRASRRRRRARRRRLLAPTSGSNCST